MSVQTFTKSKTLSGPFWIFAFIPLILLGMTMTYIIVTGGGLGELAGPPVEQINIIRVTLPAPGRIQVQVVNDGPQEVTIPQVFVDEAYWRFSADPSTTIPRLGQATFTIPYPWVAEETHEIVLITSLGATFATEIPVAVETPRVSAGLFWRFGLVGLYVGIIPVFLGMLWYPLMRRLSNVAMNFILSLTVGLLLYLTVGTWLDALEFTEGLPAFWQGVPLVVFVAMIALGILFALSRSNRSKDDGSNPLSLAYRIALGIGLHNLGEGLAIGAAFATGEAALGIFLVLGFTLHNITEGVGIAAPLVRQQTPDWQHFAFLILLAGGPAILGTWIGGFAFNPVLATIFLAVGVGAILQVVWEVGRLVARSSERLGKPLINWVNFNGCIVGILIMYLTAFLVKS